MIISTPARRIASRDEWIEASRRLVAKEKELTRAHDALARERQALPWVRVSEPYGFDTLEGRRTLAELFGDDSQLIVYHFMLAPGDEAGCIGCSFLVDQIQGALVHLRNHGVRLVCVSRAPLAQIERYRQRMGWTVDWASSNGSDFNYDFGVSFRPAQIKRGEVIYNFASQAPWGEEASGVSVFFKDEQGTVFHTYSSFGRGGEALLPAYALLDMTPLGRREPEDGPKMTSWVRRHDEYPAPASQATSQPASKPASSLMAAFAQAPSGCCG
ncbi:thioredoxin family protein [Variovorax dokdonensis]|uniref:Thioredoxin family protein n=1 Tax=Variovorax dokdonensis TaxID=344883 RepID=A0ABT7NDM4_9BURK|nr:thioredoxin family protein [Variovorax dokdonensis]MDM0046029.1 thioredoxin family protein [Variovorax dokdonensis]